MKLDIKVSEFQTDSQTCYFRHYYVRTKCQLSLEENDISTPHSSKILTIQQGITRGVSSVGKPCRSLQGFPR